MNNIPLTHIKVTHVGKPRLIQFSPSGDKVMTLRGRFGDAFAEVQRPTGRIYVPAEMAGMAAGKDKWMRLIAFKCQGCGERHPAEVLHGKSDLPGNCEACAEKFFHCNRCNKQHHPDDPCASQQAAQHQLTAKTEGGAK